MIRACRVCKKQFKTKPFWVKKGHGKYCSAKCHHGAMRTGKVMKCFSCGKEVYKTRKALRISKSRKWFCTKSCQTRWRNAYFSGDKHSNWKEGLYSYRSVLGRHKTPRVCQLCGTKDSRVLAVHHIDKNRKNNTIENLAYLCHNCHFLVHHYDEERRRFMVPMV